MNYGYQNEVDFVNHFNNKYIYELDSNSQNFLKELFPTLSTDDPNYGNWRNNNILKLEKMYTRGQEPADY